MYIFTDTTENSVGTRLPTEAMRINGEYIENLIPGYRTLSVSGREALSAELGVYETGVRDGSSVKHKRYPARNLIVKYQIISPGGAYEFRQAYNALAGILNVEDAQLIFNDEPDKFFIGTPTEIGEVEPGTNAVVGEFTIFCADPFKYSLTEHQKSVQTISGGGKGFVINYNGTHKTYPRIKANFYTENEVDGSLTGDGDCGYVAFFNDREKILQFGNPDELDGVAAEASQRLTHWYFDSAGSWGDAQSYWVMNNAANLIYNEVTGGSMKTGQDAIGRYYLTPADYSSGNDKFGPAITRILPADSAGVVGASDFLFEFDLSFAPSSGSGGLWEVGVFYALAENASGKIVAGIRVAKFAPGTTQGKIEYFVNGKQPFNHTFDASHANNFFGNNSKVARRIYIKKIGKTVTFNVGGTSRPYTCPDSGFESEKVTKISFVFMRYKDYTPLAYNGIYFARFTKYNCSTYAEIPNKFSSGDVLEVDCKEGEVYLNGLTSPELGAIGNDWENFYLQPGENTIGIGYSDWLTADKAPTFTLMYREVFL